MLDLVHLGEGRPHTRRRRTIDDLRRSGDAPDQLERVLEKLVEGRLVTTGDGDLSATHTEGRPVDLAHDALISGWGELAAWIKDRQGDLIKQRRLETWAREWDEGGRTRGLLDEGDKAEARAWKDSSGGKALGVSQRLVDLIAASESEHTRIRREKEALLARLLAEQRKTRASIVAAVQVANEIVFQVDTKLRTVAGASSVREVLLARSRNLFQDLRAIGGFEADAQRTEMAAKSAQANFALERGRLDEARRLFRQVHEHAQRETAADPDNHGWKRALAVSYSGLGDVAVAIGELDDARAWFDKALAVAEGIANDDPADTTWQRDLSVSYNKLGDVAVAMGKLDDARVWFEKSLTVVKMLAAADPTNTAWQHDLSISQNKLGDIAAAAGKLEDARAWFDNAIVIAKALTAADPTNTTWQRDLSLSYVRLGDVAVAAGKLDDARAWFNKDLVVAKMLAAADSTNTTWQRDLSVSYDRLGHVAMAAGNLNDARIRFDKALAIRETLAATDSTNTTWQRDLSVSYDRLGHVAMAARNFDDARAWFDKDLAVAKALAAADPTNASWQRDLCNTLAKIAQVARDANETRRYLDKARVIYDELQRSSFFQHDIQFTQLGTFLEQLAARIDTVKSVDTISLSYEGAIAIARL